MEIDLEQLKALARALRRYDLSKIEIKSGEQTITLERAVTSAAGVTGIPSAFPMATGGREPADGAFDPVGRPSLPPPPVSDDPLLVEVTPPVFSTHRTQPTNRVG